jgi:hypothetical protein
MLAAVAAVSAHLVRLGQAAGLSYRLAVMAVLTPTARMPLSIAAAEAAARVQATQTFSAQVALVRVEPLLFLCRLRVIRADLLVHQP